MALLSTLQGCYAWSMVLPLALLVSLTIVIRFVNHRLTSPLRKIPAIHWLGPWSSYYNIYIKYFYSIRLNHYEAHTKSKGRDGFLPVVRVGPNEVSIMTSEGVKVAWAGGFERSQWYNVFQNFGYVFCSCFEPLGLIV